METTHGPACHPQCRRGGARRSSRQLLGPRGGTLRRAQGPRLEGDLKAPGRPARPLPRPGLAVYSFSERKP